MKYQACYWQHFSPKKDEYDNLQDAINFLTYGSDYGYLYAIGIFLDGKLFWREQYGITDDNKLQQEYDETFAKL